MDESRLRGTDGGRQGVLLMQRCIVTLMLVGGVQQTGYESIFILQEIEVLNVAGPRASGEPRAYDYARETLLRFLSSEIVSTGDVD